MKRCDVVWFDVVYCDHVDVMWFDLVSFDIDVGVIRCNVM